MTAEECEELADALLEEAATALHRTAEFLLSLALAYRGLANLKRTTNWDD